MCDVRWRVLCMMDGCCVRWAGVAHEGRVSGTMGRCNARYGITCVPASPATAAAA